MPRVGQVRCADLITAQMGSFSFLFLFLAQVGPFEFWLLVSPGPLSAHYGVWHVVDHFGSTFTNLLPPSLAARQPLSSPTASTIYEPFPASATVVIIVSDFKLKVVEYSTLSLRGDVRIYYSLGLLSFLLEFISYLN
jgi:hypothetical protein